MFNDRCLTNVAGIRHLTLLDATKFIWNDYITKDANAGQNQPKANRDSITSQNVGKLFLSAMKGKLLYVPISLCTNQYAFSYGVNGWHYFRDLANELIHNPSVELEKTRFYRFFHNIKCFSYTKLMTLHCERLTESLPTIPFGSFPWGNYECGSSINSNYFHDTSLDRSTQNFMWFETGAEVHDILVAEFNHILKLLESLRSQGYKPIFSKYDFPEVSILKNSLAEVRFTQIDGAHRLAILAALGYERVVVKLDVQRYPPVYEDDVDDWPYVKSGLMRRDDALRLFRLYFDLDGTERVNFLFKHL